MTHTTRAIACGLVALTAAGVHASGQQYVASRTLAIEFQVSNATEVTNVDLWVTEDGGRNWHRATTADHTPGSLRYTAPDDGRYGLYLVLHNAAGTSSPAPNPGTSPLSTVVVDTIPPLLQVHRARAEYPPGGPRVVQLRASLVEENLSPEGIRVFYRTPRTDWIDGGQVDRVGDDLMWHPPADVALNIELRVVAADLAGNRAPSNILTIELPAEPQESADIDAGVADGPELSAELTIKPVRPVLVGAVAPKTTTSDPSPTAPLPVEEASPSPAAEEERLAQLRKLAAGHMDAGRFSLAVARLEDALESDPEDADLLVDLGSALYRMGRYETAVERFQAAIDTQPTHTGALEGLALVAATEKRYPEAREHLRRLLEVLPESGEGWLHYGDIEHRLGDTASALKAWQRVLDVPDSDEVVRQKAQRRLEYFRQGREAG